mmetsp:Transcript_15300/g.32892  ORF Transcript_15300/g.32892 Transcript_15300/m.32892 type:complete len:239 (+) Transcript_15300:388-1104(+)|eukprot:CAMPEP_0185849346 /NCGR_PEP_ID=MMETSP1354-20130828/3872_1 /TAXON_ID=708628 /ORGANISM="Erythrolobus madagascarensis, Strain CCMP3276" /LENGTH=238 /DNA_ID=CAMNT_0028549849 /DNA_START=422 /DNA_END=1138 /DNA_ORIENTATION=-
MAEETIEFGSACSSVSTSGDLEVDEELACAELTRKNTAQNMSLSSIFGDQLFATPKHSARNRRLDGGDPKKPKKVSFGSTVTSIYEQDDSSSDAGDQAISPSSKATAPSASEVKLVQEEFGDEHTLIWQRVAIESSSETMFSRKNAKKAAQSASGVRSPKRMTMGESYMKGKSERDLRRASLGLRQSLSVQLGRSNRFSKSRSFQTVPDTSDLQLRASGWQRFTARVSQLVRRKGDAR